MEQEQLLSVTETHYLEQRFNRVLQGDNLKAKIKKVVFKHFNYIIHYTLNDYFEDTIEISGSITDDITNSQMRRFILSRWERRNDHSQSPDEIEHPT